MVEERKVDVIGETRFSPTVVTCRKVRPKVDPNFWCRSCSNRLKKRCTGVQNQVEASPGPAELAVQEGNKALPVLAPTIYAVCAADAAALDSAAVFPSKRRRSNSWDGAAAARPTSVRLKLPSTRLKEDILDLKGSAAPGAMVEAPAEEKWVQCEACEKWRRLPDAVDLKSLPVAW